MFKIILILLTLFIFNGVAIIVGYYNTLLGISMLPIKWVYEEVPLISTTFVLTLSCPVYCVLGFFTSKGKYEIYKSFVITYTMLSVFIIFLIMLPGATEIPGHLGSNLMSMLWLLLIIQYISLKNLMQLFWALGGRETET